MGCMSIHVPLHSLLDPIFTVMHAVLVADKHSLCGTTMTLIPNCIWLALKLDSSKEVAKQRGVTGVIQGDFAAKETPDSTT